MTLSENKKNGFTLIEIVMVIGIIGILSAIIALNLFKFRAEQSLHNTTSDIISLLNEARINTISSKNSTNYGVHFETNRAVLFTGGTFAEPNSTNKQIDLDSSVLIPVSGGINLNGGGSDVIFTRLSGDTVGYGTIIVRLASDATRQKTITINKTGVASSN
jgi:prepilin-type N-terminal cleavage/methylation domain-containing protein